MYLSRLILNPRNRRVQKEVADPYQMHRSLMNAFPDDLASGAERVLFRLESAPQRGGLSLLVQSWNLPDWGWLEAPNARGYLLPVDVPNPAVKPFDVDLSAGQVLAFRLRANPTARRTLADGTRKRIGLCREEEQMAWLERKGEQHGFRALSVCTANKTMVNAWSRRGERAHKLTFLAVQFDGLLQVTKPDQLRESVRQGIGSGKGLGFGLLSLAKPPA